MSTHEHSDHIMAAEKLKKRLPHCKTVISAASGASADILVRHGDRIQFGRHNIEVRATPGHTHGCNIELDRDKKKCLETLLCNTYSF